MEYQLEAVYLDGSRERWSLFASSPLLASQEAQDSALKLSESEPVTVYLFDDKQICIGVYR